MQPSQFTYNQLSASYTSAKAFGNANRPAASLYNNSLLMVCRYSGPVTQIPAGFRPLVRSKIAGLKGQIYAVGGNDTIVGVGTASTIQV